MLKLLQKSVVHPTFIPPSQSAEYESSTFSASFPSSFTSVLLDLVLLGLALLSLSHPAADVPLFYI